MSLPPGPSNRLPPDFAQFLGGNADDWHKMHPSKKMEWWDRYAAAAKSQPKTPAQTFDAALTARYGADVETRMTALERAQRADLQREAAPSIAEDLPVVQHLDAPMRAAVGAAHLQRQKLAFEITNMEKANAAPPRGDDYFIRQHRERRIAENRVAIDRLHALYPDLRGM